MPLMRPLQTKNDPYLPYEAEIVGRIEQSKTIFSIKLRFTDPTIHKTYQFSPGQFNMLYLYGVGEVPISIASDPDDKSAYNHIIRRVGRVTEGLSKLNIGDHIGLRGPYGRGWPIEKAKGKDIVIVTGGLGCAPVITIIEYIFLHRSDFGKVKILQGIKHSDDFLFQRRYDSWRSAPDTEVFIAADEAGPKWPFYTGYVTNFLQKLDIRPEATVAMMCGPESMMRVAVEALTAIKVPEDDIYLSMERSMHCAIAHCGHCQYGSKFICKDGPVFAFSEIKDLFEVSGF